MLFFVCVNTQEAYLLLNWHILVEVIKWIRTCQSGLVRFMASLGELIMYGSENAGRTICKYVVVMLNDT